MDIIPVIELERFSLFIQANVLRAGTMNNPFPRRGTSSESGLGSQRDSVSPELIQEKRVQN